MKTKGVKRIWSRVESLGCYWDAKAIYNLRDDTALSAALSCHASHMKKLQHRVRDGVFQVIDHLYYFR